MELVMDLRVTWDSRKLKEIEEAKRVIMDCKRAGYEILKADGHVMERFRADLEEVVIKAKKVGKKVLKILCAKGDERLTWDKDDGLSARAAKAKFVELIDKGYSAYSVDLKGQKNMKIEEFDVEAEEILMVPSTAKG